jgi:hypothetical protein
VHRSLLDPVTVARLHRHLAIVMTWPVNDPVALADVVAFGAGGRVGVISDEDPILARLLADRPASPRPDGDRRPLDQRQQVREDGDQRAQDGQHQQYAHE